MVVSEEQIYLIKQRANGIQLVSKKKYDHRNFPMFSVVILVRVYVVLNSK
jgi:hypothetical protein